MLVINCNEFKSTKSNVVSLMKMDFVQLQWDYHRKCRKITFKLWPLLKQYNTDQYLDLLLTIRYHDFTIWRNIPFSKTCFVPWILLLLFLFTLTAECLFPAAAFKRLMNLGTFRNLGMKLISGMKRNRSTKMELVCY